MKRAVALLLCLVLMLGLIPPVNATDNTDKLDDIVILYTNDVHTYIDGALSYDVIAAIKADLKKTYENVFLVDAGDHIQGTAYGSMDNGKTIVELMNAAGYDLATLGNHEFDYGMKGCMNVINWADYEYLSCNFRKETDGTAGDTVLKSYELFSCGDTDIAFVGITTPATMTTSTPAYFQDENGNYIYGISGGEDGSALYADVQAAINSATDAGAEIVIALGHLGVESEDDPWSSKKTIANVSGLDAFIDGHSHTVMEGDTVTDKDGKSVLLTQTGEYFGRIGIMIIDADTGEIETDFIEYDEDTGKLSSQRYSGTELLSDDNVANQKTAWIASVKTQLGKKIGTAEVTLNNYDENGNRLVRSQETNSGNFAADALYYLFDDMGMDVDVAIMNGGGVRNKAISGDLTYLTCKEIHTFGNVACLITVTGQQLLDALEWGSRSAGVAEAGSFLQVSGLTYKVDTSIEDTTQQDDKGVWTGAPEEYRVYDVKVYNKETNSWDDLNLTKKYNLAGYNYTLRDLGDGFAMFKGAANVLDYVMEDYMVLANYVSGFEAHTVTAINSPLLKKYPGFLLDYGQVSGSGRIQISCPTDGFSDLDTGAWYHKAVDYVYQNNLMIGISDDEFAPMAGTTRAMMVTILWRMAHEPTSSEPMTYTDVDADTWYTEAIRWATAEGIVEGYSAALFGPNDYLSREELATMLYRYAERPELEAKEPSFSDWADVSYWAEDAMTWACQEGLFIGKGNGILDPSGTTTRAEVAQVIVRFN